MMSLIDKIGVATISMAVPLSMISTISNIRLTMDDVDAITLIITSSLSTTWLLLRIYRENKEIKKLKKEEHERENKTP
ncbi:hypothetical protein V6R21_24890 [Limibacter armeniacum]|uniref:hypothetical protein n=1 Tax=Limibacter armeniacum TaxID=466084 RepID=UPI002FE54EED